MLKYLTIKTITLFSFSILLFSGCLPSTDTDPYIGGLEMWEEPRHQLVLSKDHFKVMDVVIPAGDTCLFHIHRHPTIYVLLNGASYGGQNWGKEWANSILTDMAWSGMVQDMTEPYTTSDPPVYHRVTIPDDETYHLIAIINTGKGVQDEESSSRPVNSKWFRENRFEVAANQQSQSIQMKYPAILIQYTDGLTSILENKVEHGFKSEQGGYSYHEANTTFQINNKSSEEQKFVAIELK